jgi:hypothetical protein
MEHISIGNSDLIDAESAKGPVFSRCKMSLLALNDDQYGAAIRPLWGRSGHGADIANRSLLIGRC